MHRVKEHGPGSRAGFTLVEVMMAIVVLGVGLVAASRMFAFGRLLSSSESGRIDALLECERALERVLAADPTTLRTTPSLPSDIAGSSVGIVVTDLEPRVRLVEVECRYTARRGVAAYERLAALVGDIE